MWNMGQKSLEIGHFERRIVALITLANAAQGGTIRSLSAASGVSRARLDRILRGESSMTTTDLQSISGALNLVPWKLALAAETGCTYKEVEESFEPDVPAVIAPVTPLPGYGDDVAREDLPASYAALDLGVDPAVEAREVEARL